MNKYFIIIYNNNYYNNYYYQYFININICIIQYYFLYN